MNVLPVETEVAIVRLRREGASVGEIVKTLGVHKGTVERYIHPFAPHLKKLRQLMCDTINWLDARGIDEVFFDSPLGYLNEALYWCDRHPDAVPFEDITDEEGCRLCKHEGMVRHHAKRKAEGRPIVPPWRSHDPGPVIPRIDEAEIEEARGVVRRYLDAIRERDRVQSMKRSRFIR